MARVSMLTALLCGWAAIAAAQSSAPPPPDATPTAAHPDAIAAHPDASAAQPQTTPGAAQAQAAPPTAAATRLPPDVTTHHTLALPGRTLHFTATAGSITLRNDKGAPEAEIAFIAYQTEDADRQARPVTFVFNGGPGMASGWLQVGAVGPWRVDLGGANDTPSSTPAPLPNAETWLDFTDLVFIDPPGTGYSRVRGDAAEARKRFFSVRGDVEMLADVIRRWLDRNDRIVSPKYLLGESYGGFRAPRLARTLQSDEGVGVRGMVLLSPLLDAHNESGFNDPFEWVDRLPSEVAAARALKGPVTRADVADAEHYADGPYLTDLLRAEHDPAAMDRVVQHVAALTGLDPALVRRYHGRLDSDVFLHVLQAGRVGSQYDATIENADPFPQHALSQYPDPVLEGFKAPVTGAMVAIYRQKLNWHPDTSYALANDSVFAQWDWGHGMGRPESLSYLQTALSLDPHLRVLIAHGLFDLRTPYGATARMLDSLPDVGPPGRVRLVVYPGGHMFYSQQASRAALHQDAEAVFHN